MERRDREKPAGAEEPRPDPREGTASERPERERTSMDREPARAEDPMVRREEDAAAAEAGQLGGPAPETEGDEASRPLEEAGGGEAEGFEQSERQLGEQAAHGQQRGSPEVDAMTPEVEADRASPAYAEPDEVDPTEVTSDPREEPDDPGEGPGIASER